MALLHEGGIEIACNLLDCGVTSPNAVEAEVRRLAAPAGGSVVHAYRIGLTPQQLADAARRL